MDSVSAFGEKKNAKEVWKNQLSKTLEYDVMEWATGGPAKKMGKEHFLSNHY